MYSDGDVVKEQYNGWRNTASHTRLMESFLASGQRGLWWNSLRRTWTKVAMWAKIAGLDGRLWDGSMISEIGGGEEDESVKPKNLLCSFSFSFVAARLICLRWQCETQLSSEKELQMHTIYTNSYISADFCSEVVSSIFVYLFISSALWIALSKVRSGCINE